MEPKRPTINVTIPDVVNSKVTFGDIPKGYPFRDLLNGRDTVLLRPLQSDSPSLASDISTEIGFISFAPMGSVNYYAFTRDKLCAPQYVDLHIEVHN
jgi:hypothetical protein